MGWGGAGWGVGEGWGLGRVRRGGGSGCGGERGGRAGGGAGSYMVIFVATSQFHFGLDYAQAPSQIPPLESK